MAVSRGIKLARLLRCAGGMDQNGNRVPGCPNYRNSNGWGGESGIPNWHHCGEPLANRPKGMEDSLPGCGLPIDNEALAGPANFCPLGLWEGLEPIDEDKRREVGWKIRKDLIMSQPFLRAVAHAVGLLGAEDAAKFYEGAVKEAELPARIVQELAKRSGRGITDLETAQKERMRQRLKPLLKRSLEVVQRTSDEAAGSLLVEMVEKDGLAEWLALELKEELGLR